MRSSIVAIVAIVTALTVAAFQPSATAKIADDSESKSAELSWKSAPEKSFVHIDDGWAIRCWKRPTGFECLQVSDLTPKDEVAANPDFGLSRFLSRVLPTALDTSSGGGRYFCDYRGLSMSEYITQDDATLTKNDVYREGFAIGQPWKRGFVENYFENNNIQVAAPYFVCDRVGAILANGSLATIGTTSLSWVDVEG